jgi:probable HAF family extracellular repeat protein
MQPRINDTGQVVGMTILSDGSEHAFLYSGGVMTDLGTLPGFGDSVATAINNAGQVVGRAYIAGNATSHAFLY